MKRNCRTHAWFARASLLLLFSVTGTVLGQARKAKREPRLGWIPMEQVAKIRDAMQKRERGEPLTK